MRIAVLILGLLLGLLMFLQAFVGYVLGSATNSNDIAAAGGVGLLVALMWLLASALVMAFPLASTVVFLLSMPLAWIAASSGYSDMWIWSGASFVLAVMSYFGWRGKRKQDRAREEELERQYHRDRMLIQMIEQQRRAQPTQSP